MFIGTFHTTHILSHHIGRYIAVNLFIINLISCAPSPLEASFYVEGNCEECKKIIEQKVQTASGVIEAEWNYRTSFLSITYSPHKINTEEVQRILASTGFTTQYYPPSDSARRLLPACCQMPIERELDSPGSTHH